MGLVNGGRAYVPALTWGSEKVNRKRGRGSAVQGDNPYYLAFLVGEEAIRLHTGLTNRPCADASGRQSPERCSDNCPYLVRVNSRDPLIKGPEGLDTTIREQRDFVVGLCETSGHGRVQGYKRGPHDKDFCPFLLSTIASSFPPPPSPCRRCLCASRPPPPPTRPSATAHTLTSRHPNLRAW